MSPATFTFVQLHIKFGACLMAEPALVADCIAAMEAKAGVPVTVKCRIGIDDQDAEESPTPSSTRSRKAAAASLSCMRARLGLRA